MEELFAAKTAQKHQAPVPGTRLASSENFGVLQPVFDGRFQDIIAHRDWVVAHGSKRPTYLATPAKNQVISTFIRWLCPSNRG